MKNSNSHERQHIANFVMGGSLFGVRLVRQARDTGNLRWSGGHRRFLEFGNPLILS